MLVLRDVYQLLAIGVEDSGFGDESHPVVVSVYDRQHPGVVIFETRQDVLYLLPDEYLVWRLNHVCTDRRSPLFALEHVLSEVVQLYYTKQVLFRVKYGEYVSMGRGDDFDDVS